MTSNSSFLLCLIENCSHLTLAVCIKWFLQTSLDFFLFIRYWNYPHWDLCLNVAWSSHPRWVYILISVHPLVDQCLLHPHRTHTTDLPTHLLLPQAVIVLTFRFEHFHLESLSKGQWVACSSASFPGNWWANLLSVPLITGNYLCCCC